MLKKIVFIALIVLVSCNKETKKDYATISGKIINHLGNDGDIVDKDNQKRDLKISKDGVFSDTIHVKGLGESFTFSDGNEFTGIYIENGDDVILSLDTKEFDETITYKGKGAKNNNYLAQKSLLTETLYAGNIMELDEKEFKLKVNNIISKLEDFLTNYKGLSSNLIKLETESILKTKEELLYVYEERKKEMDRFSALIGKPSPNFVNYENYKGGTTSLKDLRRKYVYVDVWATWCGPCKAEIPYLQKLEKEFHGKDIEFVSISV